MKQLASSRVNRGVRFGLSLLALAAAIAAQACADPPRYFRQDHGRAASDDQPLPADLDPSKALWKTPLPAGHSTPTIVGERIFLTGHEGPELLTVCLDRASGALVWKQAIHAESLEKVHAEGSPAAATVASDGRRVVAFFGSFGLACYDLDGAPLWTKKLGPFRDEFGAASSPILVDGKIVICEDHDLDSYLMAVDAATGATLWQAPRDGFTRSYATPVVWQVGGRPQIVMAGALELIGYDLGSGKQLWSLDGFARIVNTTPAAVDGTLYVCTWSPGGDSDARIAMEPWSTALDLWDKNKNGKLENEELPGGEVRSRFFRIDLNSDQALDEAEWNKYARLFELAQNTMVALKTGDVGQPPRIEWEYKRGLPYVASPLVYRGHVYLVKDGGVVTVLDASTGKLIKQVRARGGGNYYASPVAGDGKIYTASGAGAVTVFAATEKLEVLGAHDFGERIAATPVLADGRVYLRTAKALYCFGSH